MGDALPDVIQLGNTWIPESAALGGSAAQAAAGEAPALDTQDFFPGVLDAAVIDGATLAVPWYADTRLLFYRSDWFAAGLPGAWPAWLAEAERVQARLGPGQHALLLPLGEWEVPVALALQHGADLLRDGDRYGNFRQPRVARPSRSTCRCSSAASRRNGRGAAREPAPGLRGRRVRSARHRAMEPARVRGAAAGGAADEVGDGAAAGLLRPGPGSRSRAARASRSSRSRSGPEAAWAWIAFLAEPAQQAEFHRLSGDLPRAARRGTTRRSRAAGRRLPDAARLPSPRRSSRNGAHREPHRLAHGGAVREGRDPGAVLAALDADADQILEKRRSLLARRTRPE